MNLTAENSGSLNASILIQGSVEPCSPQTPGTVPGAMQDPGNGAETVFTTYSGFWTETHKHCLPRFQGGRRLPSFWFLSTNGIP